MFTSPYCILLSIHLFPCFLTFSFFFFNDTATTEIYTLSLHDALPISSTAQADNREARITCWLRRTSPRPSPIGRGWQPDRKSTRLNSSHLVISYAVFCLKKKKKKYTIIFKYRHKANCISEKKMCVQLV